jgi:hypothetical protein
MRLINGRLQGNKIRVKLFSSDMNDVLDDRVNTWLSSINHEIISIEFDVEINVKSVLVVYKI